MWTNQNVCFYQWHLLFISDMSADSFLMWTILELTKRHNYSLFPLKSDIMKEIMTDLKVVRIPIQASHSLLCYFLFILTISFCWGDKQCWSLTFPLTDWIKKNYCLLSTFKCHYCILTGWCTGSFVLLAVYRVPCVETLGWRMYLISPCCGPSNAGYCRNRSQEYYEFAIRHANDKTSLLYSF